MVPHAAWKYILAGYVSSSPTRPFSWRTGRQDFGHPTAAQHGQSELGLLGTLPNYDRSQIEHYLPEALDISATDGLTVNFAETTTTRAWPPPPTPTPACARPYAPWHPSQGLRLRQRCGVARRGENQRPRGDPLNWGATVNQVAEIRRLHRCSVPPGVSRPYGSPADRKRQRKPTRDPAPPPADRQAAARVGQPRPRGAGAGRMERTGRRSAAALVHRSAHGNTG